MTGLVIQGVAITPGAGTQFPIGDWGYVLTLQAGQASLDTPSQKGARAFVTGVQVRLTADHYGLPAGTEVMVGYAEALAKVTSPRSPSSGTGSSRSQRRSRRRSGLPRRSRCGARA